MRVVPVPLILLTVSLAAGGCAGLSLEDAAPQAAAPAPDGKRLAELVKTAFGMAKLTGAPEISAVRATHDSQWGDWMFCIRSSSADPSPRYAVLIGHDAVLDVRSSVLIDGCDQETYRPLTPAGHRAKTGIRK